MTRFESDDQQSHGAGQEPDGDLISIIDIDLNNSIILGQQVSPGLYHANNHSQRPFNGRVGSRNSNQPTILISIFDLPLADGSSGDAVTSGWTSLQFVPADGRSHCRTRPAPSGWSSPRSPQARRPACCCWPPDTADWSGCRRKQEDRRAGYGWNREIELN